MSAIICKIPVAKCCFVSDGKCEFIAWCVVTGRPAELVHDENGMCACRKESKGTKNVAKIRTIIGQLLNELGFFE